MTARRAEKELHAKAEKDSQQDPPKKKGQKKAPKKRKGGSDDKENTEPVQKKKKVSKATEAKVVEKAPTRQGGKKAEKASSDKPDFELGSPAPGITPVPTAKASSATTPSPLPDGDTAVSGDTAEVLILSDLTTSSSDASLHDTVEKVSDKYVFTSALHCTCACS